MTDLQTLIRLQTWLSPAFPTGAFSYSHGLEAAIASGWVQDKETLAEWLETLLRSGPGWNDAVLLAESWRLCKKPEELASVAELSEALNFSAERHLETTAQGGAFLQAAKAWVSIPSLPENCPLPVAVGAVAGVLETDLEQTLTAYLHAYVSNQVQAALRLMKLGQQGGLELLADLENIIIETAKRAAIRSLDDLGSNTFIADIAVMQHETLQSRIFRS
ncbi:MAG: urease accessory protein UreF [Pseudomonadota bacterium]